MKTVSDQIKHEKKYVSEDAERYYFKQDNLRRKMLGDQVDAANFVIRSGVLDVAAVIEEIAERKTKGIGGKYNRLLQRAAARIDKSGDVYYDYGAIAYLGLTVVFQLMSDSGEVTWSKAAHAIATRVEGDHKARLFEQHEPAYFNRVMQSFDEQLVQQYQHKHRVIMMKFDKFDIKWQAWSAAEKIQIANKILLAITNGLPEIFYRGRVWKNKKSYATVETTPDADLWFAEFEKERGFLRPTHPPMLVRPLDWTRGEDGVVTGGYYTHYLARSLPFVKTHSEAHRNFLKAHEFNEHLLAVNKLQATAWRINHKTLKVQQEMFRLGLGNGLPNRTPKELPDFPEHIAALPAESWTDDMKEEVQTWKAISKSIHTRNKIEKGKVLAYKITADTARSVADLDRFYFAYNTDFRGRIYCATSGLSPQGEDLAKALLQFAEGVPHGESGLYWLAVHGANTFGVDKVSNEDRVKWVYENTDLLRRIADDAIATRKDWGAADKPWQFLSFVFEWARTGFGTLPDTLGFIPIGLDGSCNGLQHYSAVLRDSVGGRSVNLIDSEIPSDIYSDVAAELESLLHATEPGDAAFIKAQWLGCGFDRKLTKRPVMTLPYGSTMQSCKEYIFEWMLDHRDKFQVEDKDLFKLAIWLTPILWRAIGGVVVAARVGMDWLQHASSVHLRATGEPLTWISPVGFPVYQDYRKQRTVRIDTMLAGSINARIRVHSQVDTKEIDNRRQKQGVAPNFVHSLDSSHMVKVINASPLRSFAMIHDDFGTHAGSTEGFWWTIRKEFVAMYLKHDVLAEWLSHQRGAEDIELPPPGDLDIRSVLDSTYFFG